MAVSKRRARSNDGASTHLVSAFLQIPKALATEYYANRAREAEEARQAKQNKVDKRRGPASALPEETILAMRALKEYQGWTVSELAEMYAMPYRRVYQICVYAAGGGKIPVPADAPNDIAPPTPKDRRRREHKEPAPKIVKPPMAIPAMMAGTYEALRLARLGKTEAQEAELGENG